MSALISMVHFFALLPAPLVLKTIQLTSRWSNACQLAIDYARSLIESEDCMYGIKGLGEVDRAAAVENLPDNKVFHLRKTNSVGYF